MVSKSGQSTATRACAGGGRSWAPAPGAISYTLSWLPHMTPRPILLQSHNDASKNSDLPGNPPHLTPHSSPSETPLCPPSPQLHRQSRDLPAQRCLASWPCVSPFPQKNLHSPLPLELELVLTCSGLTLALLSAVPLHVCLPLHLLGASLLLQTPCSLGQGSCLPFQGPQHLRTHEGVALRACCVMVRSRSESPGRGAAGIQVSPSHFPH